MTIGYVFVVFNFAYCLDGCLTGLMTVPYCLLMYIQCCTYMYNAYMYIHHSRCNIIDTYIVYIKYNKLFPFPLSIFCTLSLVYYFPTFPIY